MSQMVIPVDQNAEREPVKEGELQILDCQLIIPLAKHHASIVP